MTLTDTKPARGTQLRELPAGAILLVGVVLVPLALVVTFNSYSAPDHDAYIRMAFAQVAGATIAIVTVLGLVLHRIVSRSPVGTIVWFALIAIAVISFQISQLARIASFLLTGLGINT